MPTKTRSDREWKKTRVVRDWRSGDTLTVKGEIPQTGGLRFIGTCAVTGVHEGGKTLRVRGRTQEESAAHWTVYIEQCRYKGDKNAG